MRPFFTREALWAYPLYATVGGSFGYWLQGVENRQYKILADRRDKLLEKRKRRAEREAQSMGTRAQIEEEGIMPTV